MRHSAFLSSAILCLASFLLNGCSTTQSASSATSPLTTTPNSGTGSTSPNPTVSLLVPASISAGSGATTVTLTGTSFFPVTAVQIGGAIENTTYLSSTQVTATIPASQLIQGALLSVIVLNDASTSGASAPVTFTVKNPVPAITQIVPGNLYTGTPTTSVSILGSGFVPTTIIQSGGTSLPTAYVNGNLLTAILPASAFAMPGSLNLVAVNPTPAGGSSSATSIAVNNPAPGPYISVSPGVFAASTTIPTTITVTGSNFISTSVVQFSGSAIPTTYVSSTKLTGVLSVAILASTGYSPVTVSTPTPGGGTSAQYYVDVTSPIAIPILTSTDPTSLIANSTAQNIVVNASNLTYSASTSIPQFTVLWNGNPLPTYQHSTYAYPGYQVSLTATIPGNLLTTAGSGTLTVSSPASPPAISNALTVPIVNPPPPTLTSLSPVAGMTNASATVSLTGTGFTSSSTVNLNGTLIPSILSTSGTLTVNLPAASVAVPGNLNFTVTNPAPGGGTSNPLPFTVFIGIANNAMVYNPFNGLLYVSVPASSSSPYASSVVSIDPLTGAFGTPISLGQGPDKLALSSDGNTLWVTLDTAVAVRPLNLKTGVPGTVIPLSSLTTNSAVPLAIAAVPSSPNSFAVFAGSYSTGNLAIYDNGVLRGKPVALQIGGNTGAAIQFDPTRSEIYVAGATTYNTYNYNAAGITPLADGIAGINYLSSANEFQVAGGQTYTDLGQVLDAESGALLATLIDLPAVASTPSTYGTQAVPAQGPAFVDLPLGKEFILDTYGPTYSSPYLQIQNFSTSTFTPLPGTLLVGVLPAPNYGYPSPSVTSSLLRWGTNGLAFRTGLGVYSLRSSIVKDLSTTITDLGVSLSASGGATTGTSTTYVATISNKGPATATNVAFTAITPASGILKSVTSAGTCSSANPIVCDLGTLPAGGSATVTFVVQQNLAGSIAATAQVSGSETDPNLANNLVGIFVTVTGSPWSRPATLTNIAPAAVQAGAGTTLVTLTGDNFSSATSVLLGGTSLPVTYVGPSMLTVNVPAAQLKTLGWLALTAVNPAPGGGASATLPLTVYQVITGGINHILYEPFSRKIYASLGSGSETLAGNSIAQLTPETATFATPVRLGTEPARIAISDDGTTLYALLADSFGIQHFNLTSQTADFAVYPPVTPNSYSFPPITGYVDLAVRPGSNSTVVVDFDSNDGIGIMDFNAATKSATLRGSTTGYGYGGNPRFYDVNTVYITGDNADVYGFTLPAAGFVIQNPHTSASLYPFNTFQFAGGLAYADNGEVANLTSATPALTGYFPPVAGSTGVAFNQKVAPDASLGRVFFFAGTNPQNYYPYSNSGPDGIVGYDIKTLLPTSIVPFNATTIEGTTTYAPLDLVRWGQDGLAALTSTGHLYLLRGPAVVPSELTTSTAATLNNSATNVTHGSGNLLVSLSGTNFLPGVAITWNGAYRTTTIVDANHVDVAVPASDLVSTGIANVVATNPGAPASTTLHVVIQ